MEHRFLHTQNSPNEPPNRHGNDLFSELITHIKKFLLPLGGFLGILTIALVSTHIVSGMKKSPLPFVRQQSQAVLGAQVSPLSLQGNIVFNIPAAFNQDATFNKGVTVDGDTILNGSVTIKGQSLNLGQGTITASNVLYGIKAGTGLSLTTGQNPTITNNGVTSLQGDTGAINLTAGNGISISGTTITNSDPGSSAKSFATISDGTTSLTAGNNDTLTFSGGTGISLSLDTTNKKLTITNTNNGNSTTINLVTGVTGVLPVANGGTNLSSYTAGDMLYANGTTSLSTLGIGANNTVLTSNGSAPAWSSALTLSGLTLSGSGDLINGNSGDFKVDTYGHVYGGNFYYSHNNNWYTDFENAQTSLPGFLKLNNTGSPVATLDVRSAAGNNLNYSFGTLPIASISGNTSFSTVVIDQSIGMMLL